MDESATVGTRFGFDLGDNRSLRCGILRNARRTCPRQTQDVEGFIIFFQKTGQVSCIRSVCSACNHLVRLHLAPCFSVAPGPFILCAHKLPAHPIRRATPSAARSNSLTHEPIGRALVYSPDNRYAAMTDGQ